MNDTRLIQIRIDFQEAGYPRFVDALYFTIDEYNAISEEEIEKMKDERYEAFKKSVSNAESKKEGGEE